MYVVFSRASWNPTPQYSESKRAVLLDEDDEDEELEDDEDDLLLDEEGLDKDDKDDKELWDDLLLDDLLLDDDEHSPSATSPGFGVPRLTYGPTGSPPDVSLTAWDGQLPRFTGNP